MKHLKKHLSPPPTVPQTKRASPAQEKNEAGGYTFVVSPWELLMRFLVLGTEGNTFYLTERQQTLQAGEAVQACWDQDCRRFIQIVTELSLSGRTMKRDPLIYCLAFGYGQKPADPVVYQLLDEAVLAVCRTGTDILHFCEFAQLQRGWGQALRRVVARWYGTRTRSANQLAYQLLKYRQRDGWTHRDALRLSHPGTKDKVKAALFALAASQYNKDRYHKAIADVTGEPPLVDAFFLAQQGTTVKEWVAAVERGVTREMLPTEALNHPQVWQALLDAPMPMTALIRNLGNLSKHGLLKPLSANEKQVCKMLGDEALLSKARIHPLSVLIAHRTYVSGHGLRGSSSWPVNNKVASALDKAFALCFKNAESTGLRIQVALDVSGSMDGGSIAGVPGLSPREAVSALSLLFARREENVYFTAFSHDIQPFKIHERSTLDSAAREMAQIPMGWTDCALPMLYAQKEQIPTDLFIVLTDNETWYGTVHPHKALRTYRRAMNLPDAKLVTVGLVANSRTIADPSDPGMLDVVGFDASLHKLICSFAAPVCMDAAPAEVED